MSGTKRRTISLSEQEYRRTMNQNSQYQQQINALRNELRNSKNNARRQQQLMNQLSDLHKNQQRLIREGTRNLQSDLRQAEERHTQRLDRLQNQYNNALREAANQFNEELQRQNLKIDSVKEQMQAQLNLQRKEYLKIAKEQQKELNKVKNEIESIKNKDANIQAERVLRYNDLIKLIDNIDKNYPHQKFAPGELEKISYKAKNIEADLSRELDCNSSIWAVYYELNDLRDNVIRAQSEFQHELLLARQYLEILLEISKDEEVNDDEAAKEMNLKIDFWTDNRFTKITDELISLKSTLDAAESSNLTLQEIRQISARIAELEVEQKNVMTQAIKRVIASKERRRLAMEIALRLNEKGYNIIPETDNKKEHGFVGEDPRSSYILKIKTDNMEGATETVALISPIETEEGITNALTLSTTGEYEDLQTRKSQAREVLKALGDEVGDHGPIYSLNNHIEEINGQKTRMLLQRGSKLPQIVKDLTKQK